MYKTQIWHVADNRVFPLEVSQAGNFEMVVHEVPMADLETLTPESGMYHVFMLQCEAGHASEVRATLQKTRHLNEYPKLIVVPSSEYSGLVTDFQLVPRAYLLDDSIRPRNLHLIFELLLQQEYYRQVVYGLSGDMRRNTDIFDNMIGLARKELGDARAETAAYGALIEYERSRKEFGERLEEVREEVSKLRDRELVMLKRQLAATERLSEFRDRELREAREAMDATEKALEFSAEENRQRESLLNAMDRLRSYTESELLELYNENQDLRRRLGLKTDV